MAAADAEDAVGDGDAATAGTETEAVDSLTVVIRAEVLQQVVDQLLTVVDEAIFRIGYEGLSVAAVDPANVGMVDVEVEPGAFESVGDGMFPIGLNLQRLDDYIGSASGDDPVTFTYRPETRSIEIDHTNVEVEMSGIDPKTIRDEPDIPDIDHSVEFTADAGVITDAVENAELVSDHVKFESMVDEEALAVRGHGDTDEIQTVLGADELPNATFDADAVGMYSLPYLVGGSTSGSKYAGILKPLKSGTELRVEFSEEMPVKIYYDFADDLGHVMMMLAPRIQRK
ncbi:proliferating cell antigen [Halorubrum aquaticum]|uniref:DNA polymerase sliding clamp n=1 Tax=Halorubrum aquaticum TaxID=387340 RepID=A0A1I2Z947_9EURY|nr:proliferating cell antigen [Halorubrum aquaticum]